MFRDKIKILFNRRRDNKSRYSANKVFVSRAEFKHSNSKVIIILSTYNKQKSTLLALTRKIIYFKRMYKILVELKDRFSVRHKDLLTRFLKNVTPRSRVVVPIRRNRKIYKKRYIPSMINRLNHK
jgi:hypothetical protein